MRLHKVTQTLVAEPTLASISAHPQVVQVCAHSIDAGPTSVDTVIAELYEANYRPLVRLAVLLVHDVATAEEVVHDSFVALHHGVRRLPDTDEALAYLRAPV